MNLPVDLTSKNDIFSLKLRLTPRFLNLFLIHFFIFQIKNHNEDNLNVSQLACVPERSKCKYFYAIQNNFFFILLQNANRTINCQTVKHQKYAAYYSVQSIEVLISHKLLFYYLLRDYWMYRIRKIIFC